MHSIIDSKVKSLLKNKTDEIDPDIMSTFLVDCEQALRKQLIKSDAKESISLSQMGRPICQQQYDKLKVDTNEEPDYALTMKFLYGDIIEAIAMAILRISGVEVKGVQKKVTLKIGGQEIPGTQDVDIDDDIWDIKSCSSYAFKNKFKAGFHSVLEDDIFGYVTQLFGYAEAGGKKAGGWIAIDKSTGEWAIVPVPIASNSYRKAALNTIEMNLNILKNTKTVEDVQKQFTPVTETYYKKLTGDKHLSRECSYCKFKHNCWNVEYRQSKKGKSSKWYIV